MITSDGFAIVTELGSLADSPGKLHTSVQENFLRPTDADPRGAPDPWACALRGAQEELGIAVNRSDVVFTHFGVHPTWGQYSLLGVCRIKETFGQVVDIRAQGIPKDKADARRLIPFRWKEREIDQFILTNWDRWHPIGAAAMKLSLSAESWLAP